MEKLTVKNFLVIRLAEFDVGRMNFIIGPQASGKSVLAKLLYFFREFLQTDFSNSVRNREDGSELNKTGLANFERIFPRYAWKGKSFQIRYSVNGQFVSLTCDDGNDLRLDYSASLAEYREAWIEEFGQLSSKSVTRTYNGGEPYDFERARVASLQNTDLSNCFFPSLFVPAGRSFFSSIQNNIFSFLESNIAIDPLLKQFGARFEFAKHAFQRLAQDREDDEFAYVRTRGLERWRSILVGEYVREDDQDWVINSGIKTNVSQVSSGQQEVLPMLVAIVFWPLAFRFGSGTTLLIEDPEAHLFPTAQKQLLELFALTYNKLQHSYVITTHSPYILTAVNNLTLAKDVQDANPGQEIDNMPHPDLHIAYEDVRAYTIEDGVLVSIMDDENRLIGASVIDEVSDEFSAVFDHLLEVQLGG